MFMDASAHHHLRDRTQLLAALRGLSHALGSGTPVDAALT
jgi:hypothetical protein